jgi:hypothetical protein
LRADIGIGFVAADPFRLKNSTFVGTRLKKAQGKMAAALNTGSIRALDS